MNADTLPLTSFKGKPADCGEAYGEKFGNLILGFCKQELRPDRRRVNYAARCWELVLKHAPASATFMRGVARGSGLSIEHITLTSLHEEIYHEPHCTAFIATGDATRRRETIVAQNWDWLPQLYPWAGLLKLDMTDSPRTATYHYPGLWACAGINEHGLALMWTGGGYLPKVKPLVGLPTYVLIAEVLRRRSVDDAVRYIASVPLAGCFLFFLGDADGDTAVVEAAAGKHVVDRAGDVMLRANHYTCPDIVRCSRQRKLIKDPRKPFTTLFRAERMAAMTRELHGRIDRAAAQQILSDRTGPWPWLHQFPKPSDPGLGGMTIDSLFAVCGKRELWAARGGREPGRWQRVSP